MRSPVGPFVAALVLALLLLVATPAAHAASWSAHDRRGDVIATSIKIDGLSRGDDCPRPARHRVPHEQRRDITSLEVDHGVDSLVLALGMREVARSDANTDYTLHVRTPRAAYRINVMRGVDPIPGGDDKGVYVLFSEEPDFPAPSEIKDCGFITGISSLPCDGLVGEVAVRLDQVLVTIPRVCLHQPAWVRVAAESYGSTRLSKEGRFTLFSDFWAPRGVERKGFLPPFGPRVHSS